MHNDMAAENRVLRRTVAALRAENRAMERALDEIVRDSYEDMCASMSAENVVPLRPLRVGGGAR